MGFAVELDLQQALHRKIGLMSGGMEPAGGKGVGPHVLPEVSSTLTTA